jgi:hypothetical protein
MQEHLPQNSDGWLSIRELDELGLPERSVSRWAKEGRFGDCQKLVPGNGGKQFRIHICSSLIPEKIRIAYAKKAATTTPLVSAAPVLPTTDALDTYQSAPGWAREYADRYLRLIKESENLSGACLREWLKNWNKANPDSAISMSTLYDKRSAYKKAGRPGLLPGYGKRNGATTVPTHLFEYYLALYLKGGGPPADVCWENTFGYAKGIDPSCDIQTFPTVACFKRRYHNEIPDEVDCYNRKGPDAYNRKYGNHIIRDYSKIPAGLVWVSDHAQIDVMCKYTDKQGKNRHGCPWMTVWRDFKSGLWLGWEIYCGDPNSDRILQAAANAIRKHGTGKIALLDNGKDFRSKSVSGGKQKAGETEVDRYIKNARSMLGGLHYDVQFAQCYRAQSKPIERDFLTFKTGLSSMLPGYRGGDVVERPECLDNEIATGKILDFTEFSELVDDYITEVMNKRTIGEGYRAGKAPLQIWQEEEEWSIRMGARSRVPEDDLLMYCMKTSLDITISRGMAKDSELNISYTAQWMATKNGTKVYLRRNKQSYEKALVFEVESNTLLGCATLKTLTPAIVQNPLDAETLKAESELTKRMDKSVKFFNRPLHKVSPREIIENAKIAAQALNESNNFKPVVHESKAPILMTHLSDAATLMKHKKVVGDNDFGEYAEPAAQSNKTIDVLSYYDSPEPPVERDSDIDPLDIYGEVESEPISVAG